VTVSVVVPTIKGREALCEQTVAAFRATVPAGALQIIIVKDRPCIGQAWNDGAEASDGEYIMLAADDVLPHPGWLEAAVLAADESYYPAPLLTLVGGGVLSTGSMGGGWLLTGCADWAPVCSSQFPFVSAYAWREIGPSLDIHYFADDYLAARARATGLIVAYREGYHLTHLEGVVGRSDVASRAMTDRMEFESALSTSSVWAEHAGVA
jgi:GT2 family glycosyltransferase